MAAGAGTLLEVTLHLPAQIALIYVNFVIGVSPASNDVRTVHMTRDVSRPKPQPQPFQSIGDLWIAFWDGAAVRRFSPEGAKLEEIAIPAPRPTSIALVGAKAYVTSARIGLDAEPLARCPLSGGLFEIGLARDAGVRADFFDD